MNVYDFFVKQADGKTVALERYKGMVSLIANTASLDRYAMQLPGLEKLYKEYGSRGFMLLLFPCNQFMDKSRTAISQYKIYTGHSLALQRRYSQRLM